MNNSMIFINKWRLFYEKPSELEAPQIHTQSDFLTLGKPFRPLALHRNAPFSSSCADRKDSNLNKGFPKTINNCCCYLSNILKRQYRLMLYFISFISLLCYWNLWYFSLPYNFSLWNSFIWMVTIIKNQWCNWHGDIINGMHLITLYISLNWT